MADTLYGRGPVGDLLAGAIKDVEPAELTCRTCNHSYMLVLTAKTSLEDEVDQLGHTGHDWIVQQIASLPQRIVQEPLYKIESKTAKRKRWIDK